MKEVNILKNELKEMLEEISDLRVLRSIKELLESKSIEEAIRIQLIENAEKSGFSSNLHRGLDLIPIR